MNDSTSPYNFGGKVSGFIKRNNFIKAVMILILGSIAWLLLGLVFALIIGNAAASAASRYYIIGFPILAIVSIYFFIRSLAKDRLGFKIASGVFLLWMAFSAARAIFHF